MRARRDRSAAARRPPAGFTLIELLVGLAVTSMLLLAIIGVFTAGSKLARVETQVADMQQSLRAGHHQITRLVRMAGRGGLALRHSANPPFQGPALSVRNEAGVAPDTGQVAIGTATPIAVAGSDILTVRGVFATPIYQIDTLNPVAFQLFTDNYVTPTASPALAVTGRILVMDTTPTGTPQSLAPFVQSLAGAGIPEALILVSPVDERIVGVVELDPASSGVAGSVATLSFRVRDPGMTNDAYGTLYESGVGAPALPVGLTSVAYLGILEEFRFYIRQATPPRLSMARMFPGTETPYQGLASNLEIDLADHLLDLQVALAFDTTNASGPAVDRNGDTIIDEEDMEIFEAKLPDFDPPGLNDDWLFNAGGDDETVLPWAGGPPPELFFIRVTLLGRTARRERDLQAPILQTWEDVSDARLDFWNTFEQRLYKRRLQQTVIELRNL